MTHSNLTEANTAASEQTEPRVCANTSSEQTSADQISSTQLNGNGFAQQPVLKLVDRFRKFLPVVVDVETAGFNAATDALLEIACIPILMDEQGVFYPGEALNAHLNPFEGANLEQRALEFTGIDPNNPMRKAIAEEEKPALRRIFKSLKEVRRANECMKCILVGHNAHFDLSFLNAAIERTNSKNQNPFHQFSVLDTVSFSALAYGQTVLARACKAAGIDFSGSEAHSALYDTQKTAELFCRILNSYPMLENAMHSMVPEDSEENTESNESEDND
ncbi:ribonuclease T [Psychrobacter sp. FDAARGOS_221]|uniref:ribonuclease T n=1 Tax=Psychrobacter sp. FDAARGOS_221 TaxID=1975705 RepID=UPI000BB54ACE|nr:ribonuclease T [Psychrobacter sp. FDAARGOS_221]PNK60013.1 ribonuclease T [Psychrobacter sp. FDAARGOS_221]